MEYKFTWEPSGFFAEFKGKCKAEDFYLASNKFLGHEKFDELKYSIIDLRDADLSKMDMEDMYSLVAHDYGASFTLPNLRFAIIVTDLYAVKLIKFYIEKSRNCESKWKFGMFSSQAEAREWVS